MRYGSYWCPILFTLILALAVNEARAQQQAQPDPAEALAAAVIKGLAQPDKGNVVMVSPAVAEQQAATTWPALADKWGDRALDGAKEMAGKVEKILTEAAPTVWRALIAKQYAYAGGLIAIPVSLTLLFIVFIAWFGFKDYRTDDGRVTMKFIIPCVLLAALAIAYGVTLYHAVPKIIAPEWYAVEDVVEQVTKIIHGSTCVMRGGR